MIEGNGTVITPTTGKWHGDNTDQRERTRGCWYGDNTDLRALVR